MLQPECPEDLAWKAGASGIELRSGIAPKQLDYMKPFLLACCLFVVSLLSAQQRDIRLLRQVHIGRNTGLDPLFKGVSNSVAPLCVIVPTGLLVHSMLACDTVRQQRLWLVGGALTVSAVVTFGMKYAVNRPRPFVTYTDIQPQQHVGPYSFPSGHTSSAFALATSVALAFPKWYVIAPAFLWAGAAGYSRMHLGVHYPTDVAAGALIGAGSAWLSWRMNRWLTQRYAGTFRPGC